MFKGQKVKFGIMFELYTEYKRFFSDCTSIQDNFSRFSSPYGI